MHRWEFEYWKDVRERATDASRKGDQGELYRLFKELKLVRGLTADPGRWSAENLEEERAAWQQHFAAISSSQGEVHPRVWDNIGEAREPATWLGDTPTAMEIDACIRKMKNNRQPGADGMVCEALKYGGAALRSEIHRIIRDMWDTAASAEEGAEGEHWPGDSL
jgi:hypothetical protein